MYLIKKEKQIDFSNDNVENYYDKGYLFGRKYAGYIYKTRSLRIQLNYFKPNSENRRILKKFDLDINPLNLALKKEDYDWRIHKMGKDFYSKKFPNEKFSASKIKEMLTKKFHFNILLQFQNKEKIFGYSINYQSKNIFHYCYPFYDLKLDINNLGMYMMLQAILFAQLKGQKYIYLGGVTRKADKYKLQFKGLEWYDLQTSKWSKDIKKLKLILI